MESITASQNSDRCLNKSIITRFSCFFFYIDKTKEYQNSKQAHYYESNLKYESELIKIQEVKE